MPEPSATGLWAVVDQDGDLVDVHTIPDPGRQLPRLAKGQSWGPRIDGPGAVITWTWGSAGEVCGVRLDGEPLDTLPEAVVQALHTITNYRRFLHAP